MDGQETTELGWGQRYLWLRHSTMPPDSRREYNIELRYEPPAGTTCERVAAAVDMLVARHETLRTTFHLGSGDGPLRVVHPPRPLPVEHHDTSTGPPAPAIAALTGAEFDLTREWPIRAIVVSTRSVPVLLLMVVHHIALDDWSIKMLHQELEALLRKDTVALPELRHRPADMVRYENSSPGKETHSRALSHWDRELSLVDRPMFRSRREPGAGEPEAFGASLSSPAVVAAVRTLAARYRVWPNVVYTAAFSALLSGFAGTNGAYFRTYAANRDTPEQAETMACLAQPVLVNVRHDRDAPFADIVAGTAAGMTAAGENGYFAYDEALELVARHSRTQGIPLDSGIFYNYLSRAPADCGVRRTTLNWNAPRRDWARQGDDIYFRVYEYRDATVLVLSARTVVMSAQDVERFLRACESLVVDQADSDAELRVPEVAERAGLRVLPSPDVARQTTSCLNDHPGVDVAAVFPAGTADEFEAYLVAADPSLTPARLRTWLLGRMYDDPGVRCPRRFTLCAGPPDDPAVEWSWQSQAVLDSGTGEEASGLTAVTDPERALAAAVCATNPVDSVNLASDYTGAGGRVLNIPLLREELHAAGWTGADFTDLVSARPLLDIAARLNTALGTGSPPGQESSPCPSSPSPTSSSSPTSTST
ncbi:condensation domain-containing protein [Amycolatopsis sp. GM8]|uniref:condensation domain-containing protein n=1 Tax=Amycolatopsis sp. GM8 TaxID=2896530 RepID=UPI001F1CE35C|nr:condensation domain-containing protein [Amycolatopsis sp. GM8]